MINLCYCVIVIAFCCLCGYLAYIGNYWLAFFALIAIPSLSLYDKPKTVVINVYTVEDFKKVQELLKDKPNIEIHYKGTSVRDLYRDLKKNDNHNNSTSRSL